MKTERYPKYQVHLARFLSDHFGGYESVQAAADQEANGDPLRYLESYIDPMKGEGLDDEEAVQFYAMVDAADRFLAEHSDFDALRAEHFTDSGCPKLSLSELEKKPAGDGFRFLCELVWNWN